MKYEFSKGEIISIEYLSRKKVKSEVWRFMNFNEHTKVLWLYSDNKCVSAIKEKYILKIESTNQN
jgi:hypothetical protein